MISLSKSSIVVTGLSYRDSVNYWPYFIITFITHWNFNSCLRLQRINRKWVCLSNYVVLSCQIMFYYTNCPCHNIYNTLYQQNGPIPRGENGFSWSNNRGMHCGCEIQLCQLHQQMRDYQMPGAARLERRAPDDSYKFEGIFLVEEYI